MDLMDFRMRKRKSGILLSVLFVVLFAPCGADESSPWGINTHTPVTEQLDICKELGVGWIRVDFTWADIEASGKNQFNWGVLDNVVAQASARNIYIYGSIVSTPSWASSSGKRNAPPANSNDWYDFVYACVSRYSYWVCHWGMWNEPNMTQFWTGSCEDYVNLILIPGYQAVKSAAPECFVLGPELSDYSQISALEWLDFIMANYSGYIDIVTQHSYKDSSSSVSFFLDKFVHPLLLERCPDKYLWLTETGWRTDTYGEDYQALMYGAMCEDIEERDYIEKIFFYELADGHGKEKWGIITYPGYIYKPAFFSYQGYISGSSPDGSTGCFIATAAYGTPMAYEVMILSEFRDKCLIPNALGRIFVKCYYRISPLAAGFVSRNNPLRFVVRIALRPVIIVCRKILEVTVHGYKYL